MKRLILFIALCSSLNVVAQVDREFWFAFPDITDGDYGAENSIKLCLISFENGATVHIIQPAELPGFDYRLDTTIVLPANSFVTLDLLNYKGQLETSAELSYPYGLPFGVQITSDNNISCYYANTSNDSELYTLKGRNALGKNFIVPMQYTYGSGDNNYAKKATNSIQIVASEDSTEINIEVFKKTTNQAQVFEHDTLTIILNKGWCYAIELPNREERNNRTDHLENTHIWSNKPIAVNSTDDSAGASDLIGDQIVPTTLCGTSYIVINNQSYAEEVYIFPTENNTTVYIDGNPITTLNKGGKYRFVLTTPVHYITADKPIIIWQIAAIEKNLNMGGTMLPKLECTGSMETAYKPVFLESGGDMIFNIITKTAYTDGFTLNDQSGIITPSDFSIVPGTNNEWSYSRKLLTDFAKLPENSVLRIKNSKGYFHVGAYDKREDSGTNTYGYFSDYHPIRFDAVASKGVYIEGDTLHLFLKNEDAFRDIVWTKPDGTELATPRLEIRNLTIADVGMYIVSAVSKDGCSVVDDGAVVVNVFHAEKKDTTLCHGEMLEMIVDGYAPYIWLPDVTLPDTAAVTIVPDSSITYTVIHHKAGQNIIFNGNFQRGNAHFESDYHYGGSTATAVTTSGHYSIWKVARDVNATLNRVYDHTKGNSSDGMMLIVGTDSEKKRKIWKKNVDVIPNTRYKFSAWFITPTVSGTQSTLDFLINEKAQGKTIIPPFTKTVSKPEQWAQDSCFWDSGTCTSVEIAIMAHSENLSGTYVCIDDIEFSPYLPVTDTFEIDVIKRSQPIISGDTMLCNGTVTLDAGVVAESYRWFLKNENAVLSTNRSFIVSTDGIYVVETSNGICTATDTVSVAAAETLNVQMFDSIMSICPDEENLTFAYQIEGNATYDVIFDSSAIDAGFANIYDAVADGNDIIIPFPSTVPAGDYKAVLKFAATTICAESPEIPLKISVKINPNSLMQQKWNDVLALYNEHTNPYGFVYSAYQWYKNGLPMEGENGSYLYLGEGNEFSPADTYAVLLTLADGTTLMTCDYTPLVKQVSGINVQNPVRQGQQIKLANASGIAVFYEMAGPVYSIQPIENNYITVPEKKGIYFLKIEGNVTKIMVQ